MKISFAQKFKNLFSSKKIDSEFFEEMTDALVEGDMGAKLAYEITEELENICRETQHENNCDSGHGYFPPGQ